MSLESIQWGWRKDPEDLRDFQAKRLIYAEMPLPSTYWCNPNTPVYNQGSRPACVGYAGAGVKSDQEFIQHGRLYTFDGAWLYGECKKVDGIPDQRGTYPRVALKIMQGGMRQTALPCRKKEPDDWWKIKAYFRVESDSTIDFVKQVIFQYGPLLTASGWYSNWMHVGAVFPKPDALTGGHAYRACGWNEIGFIIVNSWGRLLWGKWGVATMPYDIFMNYVLPGGDIWKVIDA